MARPRPDVDIVRIVNDWVESCRRNGKIARNTYAVGVVVLDNLRKTCPIDPKYIRSAGGEIKGARSSLRATLEKYGVSRTFLKEVTTRQGPQDGQRLLQELDHGHLLTGYSAEERDKLLVKAIDVLLKGINAWFARQHLKVQCPRAKSPAAWISAIIAQAKGRSGGVVEQHLIGAKLEERFPQADVANFPGHAGDAQTSRQGDFTVGTTAYHVTASPTQNVIDRCAENILQGFHPCLIVPSSVLYVAQGLATAKGLEDQITITSIEQFVALNVLELAQGEQSRFLEVLSRIIETYNRRLKEVETDMSLRIELT
jgi:hypothetical protein